MWPPIDINAIPSPEETQSTIEAIKQLEIELQEAFEAFERTKCRILKLERDLEEHRGWIAPIRRIPVEIIIEVFLLASETDELAPIRLASVCHLWREIMFATPKAWSSVYLARHEDLEYSDVYLSTFLRHSHPRTVHICVPDSLSGTAYRIISVLINFLYRIECLTISPSQLESLGQLQTKHGDIVRFPHLRRLSLFGGQYYKKDFEISFFHTTQFPVLQFLHWPRYRGYQDSSGVCPTFAHIEHLSVDVDEWDVWLDVVESCAPTLRSLTVLSMDKRDDALDPESEIELLLLQSLRLDTYTEFNFKFITPALVSVSLTLSLITFEADIDKVTHLRLEDCWISPLPAGYIAVRLFQTYYPSWCNSMDNIPRYVESVKAAALALPSLEVIEINTKGCHISDLDRIMQKTSEKLNEIGVTIKLQWANGWTLPSPGYLYTPAMWAGNAVLLALCDVDPSATRCRAQRSPAD